MATTTSHLRNVLILLKSNRCNIDAIGVRCWHTSSQLYRLPTYPRFPTSEEWKRIKKQKGYSMNPNSCGPLTDLPDYTFLDRRPTPPTLGQLQRAKKQRIFTDKIVALTKEVNYAVERSARKQREAEQEKQNILGQKLKPKEKSFLKKP